MVKRDDMNQERKNICFGSIRIKDKKSEAVVINAVWTEGDTHYKNNEIIKVVSFKYVGKTSITNSFTEVTASDEKRNNITGAYE
jgi:hypothetical protein